MTSKIIVSSLFKREAKKLAKKYRSLGADLATLQDELMQNPYLGTRVSESIYKIRLAIASKGKGKSGGGRVITFVDARIIDEEDITKIYLLTIYDKSRTENIPSSQILNMIRNATEEE